MLPANVIQDILSRLDVKSLIRLRCVCKSWSEVISSRCFQELHRSRSHQNQLFLFRSPTFFKYNQRDRHFSYLFCSGDVAGNLHARFTVNVDGPIKLVLPTCCGLVCFSTGTRIYVCNPATRSLLPLPLCPQQSSIAGFGFAFVDSGYKVVRLIHRRSTSKIECSILTIPAASSWRVLDEDCPHLVEAFSYPVFAKDHIYWKIKSSDDLRRRSNNNDYIVSFHIRYEKFSTLTHPPDWRQLPNHFTHLADLGGMLCIVEISASNIVVWVLKDHLNSFWHKGGLIDVTGIDRRLIGEVKCLRNGEIIFSSLANLLLFYDVKKKRFRQVPLPFRAFEFGIYWEDFVSLL